MMERPQNCELPFFAYGLFRPGQLAFFQLRDLVGHVVDQSQVEGALRLRDGLPIIHSTEPGYVRGALLTFIAGRSTEAYDRISAMEPDEHYRWSETRVDGTPANVLVGKSPEKGSVPDDDADWNGWNDPLFTAALEVVEEILQTQTFSWDLKPLFRMQMAYLLLWSSIERYVSLRYHLGHDVMKKVDQLACEAAFAEGLRHHVKVKRQVHRADKPSEKLVLDSLKPKKAIRYYYQVRSNISHRGKGVVQDYKVLHDSLEELLLIFREVLSAAERDAVRLA